MTRQTYTVEHLNYAAACGYALAAREAATYLLTGPERIASAAKADESRRALAAVGVTAPHLIPAPSPEPDDVEPTEEPAADAEPEADDAEPETDPEAADVEPTGDGPEAARS